MSVARWAGCSRPVSARYQTSDLRAVQPEIGRQLWILATSIVPFQKGVAAQGQDAIEVDAFELGKIQGFSDLSLTLLRETAHVSFILQGGMGEKLEQALTAALTKSIPPIPAGPPA
jgi:hypothetical protein